LIVPVRVQTADFDVGAEIAALRMANPKIGGIASFIGCVRDINDGDHVATLTLEHYPGMTEAALEDIIAQAHQRWDFFDALIIHRVGTLQPMEQIVLVVVTSAHRGEAFEACHFIMDFLKTQAPFWKREASAAGERWLDARASDAVAATRWTR
jgi:molybdopterin synthase catalytic subunit